MPKIKHLDFAGQTIFCGIDVHKKSWRVNVRSDKFELEDYSQDPSEELLLKHLHKRYPGASFKGFYVAFFKCSPISGIKNLRNVFPFQMHPGIPEMGIG
jgi:transposase